MVRICSNQSMIKFVNSFAFWNEFRWHCLRSIHAICSIASECLTCSDVFVKYWIRIDSGYCSIVKFRLKYWTHWISFEPLSRSTKNRMRWVEFWLKTIQLTSQSVNWFQSMNTNKIIKIPDLEKKKPAHEIWNKKLRATCIYTEIPRSTKIWYAKAPRQHISLHAPIGFRSVDARTRFMFQSNLPESEQWNALKKIK